jgi:isopenicillin N synthase-like dioxygenase
VFDLPTSEKLLYRADLESGGYNGYKPIGLRELKPGIFDNTEIYNIPKFTPTYDRPHPQLIKDHWDEIRDFATHIHDQIVNKLLVLCALVLELPEDFFLNNHRYDAKSDCHFRYMKYHARSAEQNNELDNVWVKGHSDFGSLTLLFRQPVAALQVRTPEGNWKYVRPHPESITVNIADALQFLTNGFLKSSIHRVVAPPPDQSHVDRHGVLYFVRPEDDTGLQPVKSPVLERLGYDKSLDQSTVGLKAGEWVRARVSKNVSKVGVEGDNEIVKGVKAKYYD